MQNTMDINKILSNPRRMKAITGLSKEEFLQLLPLFELVLLDSQKSKNRKRKVGGGRKGNIKSPLQKLFYVLFYVKCYPTNDMSAFIFGSTKTRTQVWNRDILPLLEKTLGRICVLPVRRLSSPEEFYQLFPGITEVMIDGVERPIQRSKKDKTQKKHYSGKKKRHTRKNVIFTDSKKRVLVLTPSKHGKVHDKKLSDKFGVVENIPPKVAILADSGFQGIQKIHEEILMPKKKPRGGFLNVDDKAMNTLISSVRIKVEHTISGIKRMRCVYDVFRNKKGSDDMHMNVACGLWNFHIEFSL